MGSYIIDCPSCKQRMRIPISDKELAITCPKCRYSFKHRTASVEVRNTESTANQAGTKSSPNQTSATASESDGADIQPQSPATQTSPDRFSGAAIGIILLLGLAIAFAIYALGLAPIIDNGWVLLCIIFGILLVYQLLAQFNDDYGLKRSVRSRYRVAFSLASLHSIVAFSFILGFAMPPVTPSKVVSGFYSLFKETTYLHSDSFGASLQQYFSDLPITRNSIISQEQFNKCVGIASDLDIGLKQQLTDKSQALNILWLENCIGKVDVRYYDTVCSADASRPVICDQFLKDESD